MKFLVLGGTLFLGRVFVEEALLQGHEITILHRGITNKGLFDNRVNEIFCDRNLNLKNAIIQNYDVVLDTSAYLPNTVLNSVNFLKSKVDKYIFVSSVSVYKDFAIEEIDESYGVGKIELDNSVQLTNESYGPLKALCENVVLDNFHDNSLIIRPGLIVGRYDPTDRFSYWVNRIANIKSNDMNRVLIPEVNNFNVQFISATDLSKWIIKSSENNLIGTYNATGPKPNLTFLNLLSICAKIGGTNPEYFLASNKFLNEKNVQPWIDLPLYIGDDELYKGFSKININKAISNGLEFSSTEDIITDTLNYINGLEGNYKFKTGLELSRENDLIELLTKS
ncbi:MAG: NAD-dependent epimerase/dehydratase family protein [Chlorobiota bacterium]|jgi:2'-hydroxyisoflavone reductase|nr:NAD-dependent epimerase/dehydratase family protein [Chlorobiota bacterium]QQS67348.1 MAG: NAD-dependent epimerase/dehydratase family protein [Chlorobiota bacterium]